MNLKIKKLFFFFSVFFMIVMLSVLAADEINQIIIGNLTSSPEETNVIIPIILKNNESVAGFQFDINYIPYFIYKGYEVTSRMPNASVVVNNNSLGVLKVAVLIPEEIETGNNTILNLIFDVNSSASSGEYPTNFSNLLLGDIVAEPVNTTPVDGVVTVILDSDGDSIFDEDDICPLTYGCINYSGCQYGLKEWLPPITVQENFTLNDGQTLPLKFNVTNCSDDFFEDNDVIVEIYNQSFNFSKKYNATETGDDYIRIEEGDKYIVNIHTNDLGMSLGEYIINVSFANNMSSKIGFILLDKGMGIGKGKKY